MIVQKFENVSLQGEFQELKNNFTSKLSEYMDALQIIVDDFSQPLRESMIGQLKLINNYESVIEKIFNKKIMQREQLINYIDYGKTCFFNQIDQLKVSLSFIKIDDYISQIQKQIDILYIEELKSPKQTKVGELEEFQLEFQLNHSLKEYPESFNPQYPCITCCAINYDGEFITGGWDGKLIKFNLESIKQEVQLFEGPIKIIKILKNNCIFCISETNYKLIDKEFNTLAEAQLAEFKITTIDEYVQESHHILKLRADNGDQYIGNIKSLFTGGFKHLPLQDNINGKVVTTYFDDIIVVDQFDNFGSVIIYSVDMNNHIISTNQFTISQNLIEKAVILDDDCFYFMDTLHKVFKYDQQLEQEYDDIFSINNNLIMVTEQSLNINQGEYTNKLHQIQSVYSDSNYLMIVGQGEEVNLQIFKYK